MNSEETVDYLQKRFYEQGKGHVELGQIPSKQFGNEKICFILESFVKVHNRYTDMKLVFGGAMGRIFGEYEDCWASYEK